jgi:hypothetical protein
MCKRIENKLKYEGRLFSTNNCGDLIIVKYNHARSIECQFVNTGSIVTAQLGNIKKGEVLDFLKKTVCGVGYIGSNISIQNDSLTKLSYKVWAAMIVRGYNTEYKKRKPTYLNCFVCDEWHSFTNFNKWFYDNYIRGFEIDKDILISGNREYRLDRCCFVPRKINLAVHSNYAKKNKLLMGVREYSNGRYRAFIGKHGNRINLGFYSSEIDAHLSWAKAKKEYIIELANSYKGKLTDEVYDRLVNMEFAKKAFKEGAIININTLK